MKAIRILKKTLKWTSIIFSGLIILLLLFYAYAYFQTEKRRNIVYDVEYVSIPIINDSAAIERGGHLMSVYACFDCHGLDLGGKIMMDNKVVGRFTTANLTRGKGGLSEDYSDQDFLRALKHGINKEGKPLIVMPSNESTLIPDADLAAMISYIKHREPVDNELPEMRIGPLIRILAVLGKVDFPAEKINHDIQYIAKPEQKVSVEFGATLAINCIGCHTANFSGGPSPLPDHPPVPNISSTGRVGKWTEAEFMQTLRTGITPDGHELKNNEMPWMRFKEFSDVELKALRTYLLSFPQKSSVAAK